WKHPLSERVTFLTGFRWVELADVLTYNITFPAFNATYYWNENNHLYGGQVGGDFRLWRLTGPLSVNSSMKAGLYSNSASNAFDLRPSTGGAFPSGRGDTDLAFVGDVNIKCAYKFTQHLALSGGYQLLWIDGVALASENAAASTAASTQALIHTSGDVFYHGATAGLDVTW